MSTNSKYMLFIDDLRDPVKTYGSLGKDMVVARSTEEAQQIVHEKGMPSQLFLDHDLSGDDRAIDFLKWLANEYWDGVSPVPEYEVHSSNPAGSENMRTFMDSWKRSILMEETLTKKMLADLEVASKSYPATEKKERREISVPVSSPVRTPASRRQRIRK